MRAAVGDRIIVQGTRPGAARRDGEIVGLRPRTPASSGGRPPGAVRPPTATAT
ncbi:DUF1918 domain-containing protein [Kitasatospora sp. NPDC001132]